MRRGSLVVFAVAVLSVALPVRGGEPPRWVAFIRGSTDSFSGALEVTRTDGEGSRVLLDGGVLSADLGPDGTVFAALEEGDPQNEEGLPSSRLLRIPAEGGEPEDLIPRREGGYYLSVSASPHGDVAFLRQVARTTDPPEHLTAAIPDLRVTTLPVLAPPEEPPDTGSVVADSDEDFYRLRFTNDPGDDLSHAEQVNVYVQASTEEEEPFEGATRARVRGNRGHFFCGASACFLTWREFDVTYTVGEFGDRESAVAFADSLRPMEELAGFAWREGGGIAAPELLIRTSEGDRVELESVRDFCECAFSPVAWSPEEDRLLVITSAEGYTTLQEYAADGSGRPNTLTESSVFEGGQIVDAGYGPEGPILLLAGEGGPPGRLRTLEGERLVKGRVRAFDVQGSTMAYVTAKGQARVRSLESGEEVVIAEGAIDVSLAPDVLAGPAPTVASEEGAPVVLIVLLGVAGAALLGGGLLLAISRMRRRR